jgi:endonuclease YncB( thermonuclease family)
MVEGQVGKVHNRLTTLKRNKSRVGRSLCAIVRPRKGLIVMQRSILIVAITILINQLFGQSPSKTQTNYDTTTTIVRAVINKDECGNPLTESMLWSSIEGEIVKVSDNHILDLLMKNGRTVKVLFAMITFPETNDSIRTTSFDSLVALALHKNVEVLINPFHNDSSQVSGRVIIQSKEVNQILLEKGWASYHAPDSMEFGWYIPCVYQKMEIKAKQKGYGFWQK